MDIPVSFEYEGIQFEGVLRPVAGAGSTAVYYLMINSYFRGQLFHSANGWQFASNDGMFEEKFMVEFFVSMLPEKYTNTDP